jgi:hypothetical protein
MAYRREPHMEVQLHLPVVRLQRLDAVVVPPVYRQGDRGQLLQTTRQITEQAARYWV